jgi:hypothetical protein
VQYSYVSNIDTTQAERRKPVQLTILPSIHAALISKAKEQGTHPGRLVEWAWALAMKRKFCK